MTDTDPRVVAAVRVALVTLSDAAGDIVDAMNHLHHVQAALAHVDEADRAREVLELAQELLEDAHADDWKEAASASPSDFAKRFVEQFQR